MGRPGQRVVLGQVDHLQRQRAGLADVVEHQHATDHVAGMVVDRRGGILPRRVKAMPMVAYWNALKKRRSLAKALLGIEIGEQDRRAMQELGRPV